MHFTPFHGCGGWLTPSVFAWQVIDTTIPRQAATSTGIDSIDMPLARSAGTLMRRQRPPSGPSSTQEPPAGRPAGSRAGSARSRRQSRSPDFGPVAGGTARTDGTAAQAASSIRMAGSRR